MTPAARERAREYARDVRRQIHGWAEDIVAGQPRYSPVRAAVAQHVREIDDALSSILAHAGIPALNEWIGPAEESDE